MKKLSGRSAYTLATHEADGNSKCSVSSATMFFGTHKSIVPIVIYRSLTKDCDTSNEMVTQRLMCLEKLCRGIIISELRNYE